MQSTLIQTLVLLLAGVWFALLCLQGADVLPASFFRPAPAVAALAVLVVQAFDRWLWRYLPWFMVPPRLCGTWRGEVESEWVAPETGKEAVPIEAYAAVRQTFSSVHIRVMTAKMESRSLAGTIVREGDGTYVMAVTYLSEPKVRHRDTNPIHYGGMILHIRGNPPHRLDGWYWTDRNTRGEIRFTARCKGYHDSFERAEAGQFVAP